MTVENAREFLASLIYGLDDSRKFLVSKTYAGMFEERYKEAEPSLMMLEQEYENAQDKQVFIQEIAKEPAATVQRLCEEAGNNRKVEMIMMNKNLAMVSFVIPIIMHYKSDMSEPLADAILDEWTRVFPKTNLKKSTFEDINGGFRKKFCYITTALCENLGKGDNCYELTLLRDYRDNYLENMAGGHELVEDYYDIAPTIVNRINAEKDSVNVYRSIYDSYISRCISQIESGELEECRSTYESMVNELTDKYFFS